MLSIFKRNHSHWLIPYLEGELDPERAAILERELRRSAALSDEADRLRAHLALIRSSASTAPKRDAEYSILPKVQAELRARPGQNFWGTSLMLAASSAAAICIAFAVAHALQSPDQDTPRVQIASNRGPQMGAFGVPPGGERVGRALNNIVAIDGLVNPGAPAMTYRKKPEATHPVLVADTKSHGHKSHRTKTDFVPSTRDPFDAHTTMYAYDENGNGSRGHTASPSHMVASRDTPRNSGDGVSEAERFDADAMRSKVYAGSNSDGNGNRTTIIGPVVTSNVSTANMSATSGTTVNGDGSPGASGGSISVMTHGYVDEPSAAPKNPLPLDAAGFSHKVTTVDPIGGALHPLPTDEQNISDWSARALEQANRGQIRQAMDTWRDALMLQLQSPNYDDETDSGVAEGILNSIKSTGNLAAFRAIIKQQTTRQYLPTIEELPDWRILGQIDSMQGRYPEAANAWQHVVDTGAANGEDWYQLAVVRQKLGNEPGARAAYQNAVKMLPFLSEHQAQAQQYLSKGH